MKMNPNKKKEARENAEKISKFFSATLLHSADQETLLEYELCKFVMQWMEKNIPYRSEEQQQKMFHFLSEMVEGGFVKTENLFTFSFIPLLSVFFPSYKREESSLSDTNVNFLFDSLRNLLHLPRNSHSNFSTFFFACRLFHLEGKEGNLQEIPRILDISQINTHNFLQLSPLLLFPPKMLSSLVSHLYYSLQIPIQSRHKEIVMEKLLEEVDISNVDSMSVLVSLKSIEFSSIEEFNPLFSHLLSNMLEESFTTSSILFHNLCSLEEKISLFSSSLIAIPNVSTIHHFQSLKQNNCIFSQNLFEFLFEKCEQVLQSISTQTESLQKSLLKVFPSKPEIDFVQVIQRLISLSKKITDFSELQEAHIQKSINCVEKCNSILSRYSDKKDSNAINPFSLLLKRDKNGYRDNLDCLNIALALVSLHLDLLRKISLKIPYFEGKHTNSIEKSVHSILQEVLVSPIILSETSPKRNTTKIFKILSKMSSAHIPRNKKSRKVDDKKLVDNRLEEYDPLTPNDLGATPVNSEANSDTPTFEFYKRYFVESVLNN